eukprot:227221-Hanusia_phi.AAC.1
MVQDFLLPSWKNGRYGGSVVRGTLPNWEEEEIVIGGPKEVAARFPRSQNARKGKEEEEEEEGSWHADSVRRIFQTSTEHMDSNRAEVESASAAAGLEASLGKEEVDSGKEGRQGRRRGREKTVEQAESRPGRKSEIQVESVGSGNGGNSTITATKMQPSSAGKMVGGEAGRVVGAVAALCDAASLHLLLPLPLCSTSPPPPPPPSACSLPAPAAHPPATQGIALLSYVLERRLLEGQGDVI